MCSCGTTTGSSRIEAALEHVRTPHPGSHIYHPLLLTPLDGRILITVCHLELDGEKASVETSQARVGRRQWTKVLQSLPPLKTDSQACMTKSCCHASLPLPTCWMSFAIVPLHQHKHDVRETMESKPSRDRLVRTGIVTVWRRTCEDRHRHCVEMDL